MILLYTYIILCLDHISRFFLEIKKKRETQLKDQKDDNEPLRTENKLLKTENKKLQDKVEKTSLDAQTIELNTLKRKYENFQEGFMKLNQC